MNSKLRHILVFLMVFSASITYGQEPERVDSSRYSKFLPDYVKLQYAGGIGFLSAGLGSSL
jgi:hypothetical protein